MIATAPLRSPSHPLRALSARSAGALIAIVLGVPACSSDKGGDDKPAAPGAEQALGHCTYTNPFLKGEECRDYLGKGWSEATATQDCATQKGEFVAGSACAYDSTLGACVLQEGTDDEYQLVWPGSDTAQCGSVQRGCELFAKGRFVPDPQCKDAVDPGTTGGAVFQQPTLECREPIAGEPPGASDGKVCTWSAISACTEPGRKFEDYASCDTVLTQRPYYAAPPNDLQATPDDPRLADAAYMGEVAWIKEQVESCACVCCHSERLAPDGPANWFTEAAPIWTDTFRPRGLAMGAGWLDSSVLGAYPADQNNGFDRSVIGFPTTDPARMKRFFEAELARRGYTREELADEPPFGGFLVDQLNYQPTACANGESVGKDGSVTWTGGGARYVYLLEPGTTAPGVPPNLDLPDGTIWRLDVRSDADPVKSGIAYGSTPAGAVQRFPESGAPEALVSGRQYYLYVLTDVNLPITRCLFTYGG